MFLNTQSF